MATSRIARFIMEVAPPQYVTVMRHRTSKMLDTITEEDQREMLDHHHHHSSSASSSSSSSSSSLFPAKASSATSASSSSVSIPSADSKYFLKEVHRSLSNLNH
ncbi:hypothetical protein QN277_009934 [Acacia crassicarpa]|uniref:Uncharacterized protein n=1 Tax=Acacia crassicarpa TaxID=499986 RepID=A0AAE1IP23_9FABA|nr:hypothetical protein QN277_009934 [Acacia crassicarpa]